MGTSLHNKPKREKKDNTVFRNRIKELRKASGYKTQQSFADALPVSIETVRNWEQGWIIPDIDTLVVLADLFNCSVDYLLGRIHCKTHERQFIHDETGLSEGAIESLIIWNDADDRRKNWTSIISEIIENDKSEKLLGTISELRGNAHVLALWNLSGSNDEVERSNLQDQRQSALWYASNTFTNILEDIHVAELDRRIKKGKRIK